MIAVDTNILIYAHRSDASFHQAAGAKLAELAESGHIWCIPWPCLHEFIAIATHPSVYKPASTLAEASRQVEFWMESPTLSVLSETESHWETLRTILEGAKCVGPKIHDARITAICRDNGVKELWSADRDFTRMRGIKVVNPLVA